MEIASPEPTLEARLDSPFSKIIQSQAAMSDA
jgi:hypothetical protein